ncbi:MAG: CHAT domain-containing protein [Pseudorhodobacter sp.]|nr:CHAT domain-containing protein [Pseudorhodobacter sp.]
MPPVWKRCVTVFALICALATPVAAQEAASLDSIDPALLQAAKDGDVLSAYQVGGSLLGPWQEPQLRAALPWFRQAYRDSKGMTGAEGELAGDAALMLGRVLAALSEPRSALDLAAEAQHRYESLDPDAKNSIMKIAISLEDQAILLTALSRYDESIDYLHRARSLYEKADLDKTSVANTWLNEGVSYDGMGELDKALRAYIAAYQLYLASNGETSWEVGILANNIGWVRIRQKEYVEARTWLMSAKGVLDIVEGEFSRTGMEVRINFGIVSVEEGKSDEAINWGMQAMPYMLANRKQTLSHQRWNFEMLSRAFGLKGDAERAIFFGKMAVNAQQEFRASNTVNGAGDLAASQREWGRLYQRLADLLIGVGRISEAQAVLNMAKEEEVFEFLKRDTSATLSDTRAVLTNAELADEAKLAALAQAPIAAEQALQELMDKVNAGSATQGEQDQVFLLQDALQQATDSFDAAVADFIAAAAPEARQSLVTQFDAVGAYQSVLAEMNRPTAILQIAALETGVHLFLTLPGITLHEEVVIRKADLSRMVFEALAAIEAVSPDADVKLAALYNVLFAPVDQALTDSGTEVVMLNLDGFLRYVPFAALRDERGYLVERYAFTLYSPAVPTQFQRADRSAAATAGFGVTLAHPGFSALPGVAQELSIIFGSQGVLSGRTELDADFDERGLKLALLDHPAILHIASHFNLVPGHTDDSFLLLGDGSHLSLQTLRTTRALRFKGVDLLTLSACQTARGGDGAEIDGFGATAQLNGAGAVLASLWPVSDAATPQLMHDFYQGLIDNGLDKAEALQQAQVAMLSGEASPRQTAQRGAIALDEDPALPQGAQGMRHPFFWSAFVLMGNWL